MSERAIFDVRIWVERDDKTAVWNAAYELLNHARQIAPEGVTVRYLELRQANDRSEFKPTFGRARWTR